MLAVIDLIGMDIVPDSATAKAWAGKSACAGMRPPSQPPHPSRCARTLSQGRGKVIRESPLPWERDRGYIYVSGIDLRP